MQTRFLTVIRSSQHKSEDDKKKQSEDNGCHWQRTEAVMVKVLLPARMQANATKASDRNYMHSFSEWLECHKCRGGK